MNFRNLNPFTFLTAICLLLGGCCSQQTIKLRYLDHLKLDTVNSNLLDLGKMWTFDFPPVEYFSKEYDFVPSKEWLDNVRLSALRLPNCSASFISEDGLVMTNHHCARTALDSVNMQGEKLVEEGFYADSLHKERKVPSLYIDQLILLEDVSDEIQQAFESGKTDEERIEKRTAAINQIQKRFTDKLKESNPKDSVVISVVSFYNGGRFSVYGYKRYTDIRLVYAPENAIAFFGGDFDNFTYPRYDFDCAFFRVYENDTPLKTSNFFKLNPEGSKEGDAVFVVGNPGTTRRLYTVKQLEHLRDLDYPARIEQLENLSKVYLDYVNNNPESKAKYLTIIFSLENTRKAVTGYLDGLRNPVLMAKKIDFENKFRKTVLENANLRNKYGNPWKKIEEYQTELSALFPQINTLSLKARYSSQLLAMAYDLVELARKHKDTIPAVARSNIFPKNMNLDIEAGLISYKLTAMKKVLGENNEALNELLAGESCQKRAKELLSTSILTSREEVEKLVGGSTIDIINSEDALLKFANRIFIQLEKIRKQYDEINKKLQANVQVFGRALYDVYGTNVSPDATFTLRISDGVVKGYEYNGTIAPSFTTFYGLYDRYYSFEKKEPWNLPSRWVNLSKELDLSTPCNFVSTNDIIGGNSGSPVINKNMEVVGLAFDGNIESLPGNFIFDGTKNRTVSVHSSAIIQSLEKIYKANRLVKEIITAKIAQ